MHEFLYDRIGAPEEKEGVNIRNHFTLYYFHVANSFIRKKTLSLIAFQLVVYFIYFVNIFLSGRIRERRRGIIAQQGDCILYYISR